jgi:antitoxin (DNA-binding transcriptional repressor) of toxin-antitoxin stability system
MYSVNIAELKNILSRYIVQVKAGKEIIIRDGNLAVARLVPLSGTEAPDDELQRLAAQGKIRLGKGPIDDEYRKLKLPRVKTGAIKTRDVRQRLSERKRADLHGVAQLGLPFLAPIGSQTTRHDHTDQANQPEPETK